MRLPNPPRILIDGLTPESRRKVVGLALLVVKALAQDKPYDAYALIQLEPLELEERLALASCLDSAEGSVMAEMARIANDK